MLTEDTRVDIEPPPSAEGAKKTLADIANRPSIFRQPPLPWYRNWTNAGVVLCVIYNLAIVLLLVMGFFKFRQSWGGKQEKRLIQKTHIEYIFPVQWKL